MHKIRKNIHYFAFTLFKQRKEQDREVWGGEEEKEEEEEVVEGVEEEEEEEEEEKEKEEEEEEEEEDKADESLAIANKANMTQNFTPGAAFIKGLSGCKKINSLNSCLFNLSAVTSRIPHTISSIEVDPISIHCIIKKKKKRKKNPKQNKNKKVKSQRCGLVCTASHKFSPCTFDPGHENHHILQSILVVARSHGPRTILHGQRNELRWSSKRGACALKTPWSIGPRDITSGGPLTGLLVPFPGSPEIYTGSQHFRVRIKVSSGLRTEAWRQQNCLNCIDYYWTLLVQQQ